MSSHSSQHSTAQDQQGIAAPRRLLRSVGPAIIVASVVLGPGSMLTASRVGAEFGYAMLWVLALSVALMISTVALSARLGAVLPDTLCGELARRLGRPGAAAVGIIAFLIIASFQTSNNMAVLAALEPLLAATNAADAANEGGPLGGWTSTLLLLGLNVVVIAALLGVRRLYVPVERLMMGLVLLMIIGFAGNLFFAQPSLAGVLSGFIPSLRQMLADGGLFPFVGEQGQIVDPLWALTGMFATTFSIAGAFYQAYLVREKGWGLADVNKGLVDSVVGILVLGMITMVILITSAAVLHQRVPVAELNSAADVAQQLEPLFGRLAMVLFSLGIFAGAFSSFLVNAMVGGTLLADGLGYGGRMDHLATKLFTIIALLAGMVIAVLTAAGAHVPAIVFAQALTVLGLPVLAIALVYLALSGVNGGDGTAGEARIIPRWMLVMGVLAVVVTCLLAARTAWRLWLMLWLNWFG